MKLRYSKQGMKMETHHQVASQSEPSLHTLRGSFHLQQPTSCLGHKSYCAPSIYWIVKCRSRDSVIEKKINFLLIPALVYFHPLSLPPLFFSDSVHTCMGGADSTRLDYEINHEVCVWFHANGMCCWCSFECLKSSSCLSSGKKDTQVLPAAQSSEWCFRSH